MTYPTLFAKGSRRIARLLPVVLIILSLACGLPSVGKPTPTQLAPTSAPTLPPLPTLTPQPLPPALVESNPPQGLEAPLAGPVTLYFNQAMDRASVETDLTSQFEQNINFTWADDQTVALSLDQPMQPGTELKLKLSTDIRSAQGQGLAQPILLNYPTVGYLRLVETLPKPESSEVDPSAAIVTAFDHPVVPLGADPASLPAAFTLEPKAQGNGEWINTSTYIFYPQPPLQGGIQYSVSMNPDLTSTQGGPLQDVEPWSFTTALPRLTGIHPETEIGWLLDAKVRLSFNQPMDAASVEANFSLTDAQGNPVPGKGSWNEAGDVFTYTPQNLMGRGALYSINLNSQAQARSGTPLEKADAARAVIFTTPELSVTRTEPEARGRLDPHSSLVVHFSAPIQEKDVLQYIGIDPAVPNLDYWWDATAQTLRLHGGFLPNTAYRLKLSADLADIWGGKLGNDIEIPFGTASLQPSLLILPGSDAYFLTPQDTSLVAQVTNVYEAPLTMGSVPLNDLFALLGTDGYQARLDYQGANQVSWKQALAETPDTSQAVDIYLNPEHTSLAPGLYLLRFDYPNADQWAAGGVHKAAYVLVVSNVQVTYKVSATDALVWVVDLRTQAPLANAPVTVYDLYGETLASGQTDEQGAFYTDLPQRKDPYQSSYAVVGQPGQDTFGLAASNWSQGVATWNFDISSWPQATGLKLYMYTDRPVYRPGQTVYFRAVVRQAYNGRYTLPEISLLPITIFNGMNEEAASFDLQLSAYGTAHGEYTLPEEAQPGAYYISNPETLGFGVGFQVASYRKPEINLQVSFAAEQVLAGQELAATVETRYFFDAPAGNLAVHWVLYNSPTYFYLPGYQVGLEDTSWIAEEARGALGGQVSEGEAKTDQDGKLVLTFPTQANPARQQYTLEITAADESGQPVSGRASVEVNPSDFYIGARPDAWVGRAGMASEFTVQVVNWEQKPAGVHNLYAEFSKVTWEKEELSVDDQMSGEQPTYTAHYQQMGSTDFVTNQEGKARLAFTPYEPGVYQLAILDAAEKFTGTRTELLLWIGGEGDVVWPNLPDSRLRLAADQDAYQPGDTAQIFIPNPFGASVPALITYERSKIMEHQVVNIDAQGYNLSILLNAEHAPNLQVSVTMLGQNAQGKPDFRVGYLNLPVEPVEQTLKVTLTRQPERAAPGEEVIFDVLVTDEAGEPVQGEFSLAVADLAALALADPNSPDILQAFYGKQPNGVYTGLSLAIYTQRSTYLPLGLGGGGGSAPVIEVREKFPDTAYWTAELVTGPDGKARVAVTLPDSLTTWQVDVRGLTSNTRVGQAQTQIVTTKELLIRPVTPRFFVAGDHVQLAAIAQNNSSQDLQAQVSLQAVGFVLDDPNTQNQTINLPAGGRERVAWWGTVVEITSRDVDSGAADLVFSVQGRDAAGNLYQDAARPTLGALPTLRYTARQSFRTAGVLDTGGQILELVSLPRSFAAESGQLDLELAPSLGAAMLSALDVLEHSPYKTTEATLSRFLPNLETYRTLQQFNIEAPVLKERLDTTLGQAMQTLQATQNQDGGWGWWPGNPSDSYITAYVLLGLNRAREAGVAINEVVFQHAIDFFKDPGMGAIRKETAQQMSPPDYRIFAVPGYPSRGGGGNVPWLWERQCFENYVLTEAGAGSLGKLKSLYTDKDKLSPWAQAFLALSLEKLSPGSTEAKTLLAGLETQALRSATGVHWELAATQTGQRPAYNWQTTLSNSAIVIYTLAQRNPGSPLLADAVRYLMAHRQADGAWSGSYTTAWTLMALAQVIQGTGELGGDFAFSAAFNSAPLAQGQAGGAEQLTPVTAQVALKDLKANYPNALTIQRENGQGRLYYTAALQVSQPAQQVAPLAQGLSIQRAFYPSGEDCPKMECAPVQAAQTGKLVNVRLTLNLPEDMYYVMVEDYIPAGTEILDSSLKTSQLGAPVEPQYDPRDPFAAGWGWWYFSQRRIYDDHIAWSAEYLPAGVYELTYTLVLTQPGQYQVLPARAWQFYFPEVQANSAGVVFEVKP